MNDSFFKDNFGTLINNSKNLNNKLNINKTYTIYLINAIQLQCSLGLSTEYYRDLVFLYYWKRLECNFKNRLRPLINSKTYAIINLCTKDSHKKCCTLYNSKTKKMDYIYKSCCNNFLRKVYDKNCRHKNLQYLINESINNIIKSINQNIQTTTGTHPSSWRYGGKID